MFLLHALYKTTKHACACEFEITKFMTDVFVFWPYPCAPSVRLDWFTQSIGILKRHESSRAMSQKFSELHQTCTLPMRYVQQPAYGMSECPMLDPRYDVLAGTGHWLNTTYVLSIAFPVHNCAPKCV